MMLTSTKLQTKYIFQGCSVLSDNITKASNCRFEYSKQKPCSNSTWICPFDHSFKWVYARIFMQEEWGWSGVAKVSYILHQWGVQLILAGSWARPAILVSGKGKGRGGMFYFFCFFTFIPVLLSSLSLSFISSTISSIFFLPLPFSGRRHKMTHKGWRVIKHQHYQSCKRKVSWINKNDLQSCIIFTPNILTLKMLTILFLKCELSWRLIMKCFLRSFFPIRWFKKGSYQFLAKECAQYWLTTKRTKPAQ